MMKNTQKSAACLMFSTISCIFSAVWLAIDTPAWDFSPLSGVLDELIENRKQELPEAAPEELEKIANEIKISNVKNSVELEKSSLKETANIHQSGFLKST